MRLVDQFSFSPFICPILSICSASFLDLVHPGVFCAPFFLFVSDCLLSSRAWLIWFFMLFHFFYIFRIVTFPNYSFWLAHYTNFLGFFQPIFRFLYFVSSIWFGFCISQTCRKESFDFCFAEVLFRQEKALERLILSQRPVPPVSAMQYKNGMWIMWWNWQLWKIKFASFCSSRARFLLLRLTWWIKL